MLKSTARLTSLLFLVVLPTARGQKPPLTLDEFFNAVEIRSVQISPDGHAVVIETRRQDWSANRFRNDLWQYRDERGSLAQGLFVNVCKHYASEPSRSIYSY